MVKKDIIQQLEKLLADFDKKYTETLEKVLSEAEKMKVACDQIRDSWSGSCFGYLAKLHYGDFEKPPYDEAFSVEWGGINGFSQRWQERTPDDVKQKIAQLVGGNFNVNKFEKSNEKLASEIEDFQTQIGLLITSIAGKDNTHPLANIEKVEPRKKLKSYIASYMSRSMMTRDSEAVAQGIIQPAVIYYDAVVYEAESIVGNAQKFLKAAKHSIKWYELQGTPVSDSVNRPILTDLSLLHQDIFSKCQRLFESGEYAEAVEKSFKVVRDRLRSLTSFETGSEAFGKGKLHIKGAAASNVDDDFNNGVKFLTMAIDMFRNEKSHTSDAEIDDPQKAYEYLSLSSLALHLLERAEIKGNQP